MGKTKRKDGERNHREVWKTQPNRQRGKHKPKYNLSRRGTIAKKRNQRWNQIGAIMWENEEEENRT